MSDSRLETYERYLSAWSDVTPETRGDLLHASLSASIAFINPTRDRTGVDDVAAHLADFQRQMPGASFRTNNMVGFDAHALVEWQLMTADAQPGFTGYDAITFADDGRIGRILMFVNLPPFKIAWRSRAIVEL